MRRIEVIIAPNGETTIKPIGYAGGSCIAATKDLEQALGEVKKDTPTHEARLTSTSDQSNHLKQGS